MGGSDEEVFQKVNLWLTHKLYECLRTKPGFSANWPFDSGGANPAQLVNYIYPCKKELFKKYLDIDDVLDPGPFYAKGMMNGPVFIPGVGPIQGRNFQWPPPCCEPGAILLLFRGGHISAVEITECKDDGTVTGISYEHPLQFPTRGPNSQAGMNGLPMTISQTSEVGVVSVSTFRGQELRRVVRGYFCIPR